MTLGTLFSNFTPLAAGRDISSRLRRAVTTKRPSRTQQILVSLILLLMTAGPTWAATITVDSTADNQIGGDGACTLREAIANANANGQTTGGDCFPGSGTDRIEFNIPGAGPHEIALTATLEITDPVILDGTTQPGNSGACTIPIPDRPDYVLSLLGPGVTGSGASTAMRLGVDGSTIRGLNFQGFNFSNLTVPTSNHLIECNFIGTSADGSSRPGPFDGGAWGIALQTASSNNTIRDNLISGNGIGIRFQGSNQVGNQVYNNFIGTNRAGTAAVPNTNGVWIHGDNDLGAANQGNLISGNTANGVLVLGTGSRVFTNLIGTDLTGSFAVPNGTGVSVTGDGNFVGSSNANVRNVISGSTGIGVEISGSNNSVQPPCDQPADRVAVDL